MGIGQSKKTKILNDSDYESSLDDWPWVWAIRDPECLDWKNELDDEAIQERSLMQQRLPVPIIPDVLYLGNAASIQNVSYLEKLGITAVLNMAGPMALPSKTIKALKARNISYKRIDAEDEEHYPLLKNHWEEANEFIDESINKHKGKCVVHCVAGMNRSALIVSTYYMLSTKTNVLETVKQVRKERGNVALQNEGFQEQLVAMARQNKLLGPKPGTPESFLPPPMRIESNFDWRVSSVPIIRSHPLESLSSYVSRSHVQNS